MDRPVDDDAGGYRGAAGRGRGCGRSPVMVVDLGIGGASETSAARSLCLNDGQQTSQRHADRQANRDSNERRDDVRHHPRDPVKQTDPPQWPSGLFRRTSKHTDHL